MKKVDLRMNELEKYIKISINLNEITDTLQEKKSLHSTNDSPLESIIF